MRKAYVIGALLVTILLVLVACAPKPASTPTLPSTSTPIASTSEDIEWLATVIASESGSVYDKGNWAKCTDEERAAVGWTVLNRLRNGTFGQTIKELITAPGQYAHNKEPTSEIRELAKNLLEGQIPDTTGGATHFFSPIGMPKEGEPTTGFDIGGGLHEVLGIANKVYFPSWAKQLVGVGELDNVRAAYFMFYRTETQTSTPAPTLATIPSTSSNITNPTLGTLSKTKFFVYSEPKAENPNIYKGRLRGEVKEISGRVLTLLQDGEILSLYIDEVAKIYTAVEKISKGRYRMRAITMEEIKVADVVTVGFEVETGKPLRVVDIMVYSGIQPPY